MCTGSLAGRSHRAGEDTHVDTDTGTDTDTDTDTDRDTSTDTGTDTDSSTNITSKTDKGTCLDGKCEIFCSSAQTRPSPQHLLIARMTSCFLQSGSPCEMVV